MEGKEIYDVIIIGSGAGGATVAEYLSKNNHKILLLEKGEKQKDGDYLTHIKTKTIHLEKDLTKEEIEKYPFLDKPLELSYVEELGGTTPVSIGNACFSCSGCYDNSVMVQFEKNQLDITKELIELSNDLNVEYYPATIWGDATRKLAEAGRKLNYEIEAMPKFINFDKCKSCGLCVRGCLFDAKWDTTKFLKEIEEKVEIKTNFEVEEILSENKKAIGVKGINTKTGTNEVFKAKYIVLSAGAINSPIILKKSGIRKAGEQMFFDIFTTIGGYLKDANLKNELLMGIKAEFGPYFLSPHYSTQLLPLIQEKGIEAEEKDIIGLMLKFADENKGSINENGEINKTLSQYDIDIIKEGYKKAVDLLIELGVDEESIVATSLKGAHPGGTSAVGEVINNEFESEIKGLYVADASTIPEAPGRPPILTITAIGKRVSEIINKKLEK